MRNQNLSAALHSALIEIYDVRAYGRYGLTQLNQLMHAVQAGALAKARGFAPPLVVACLLHDIGHMVHDLGDHPAAAGVDDCHEHVGSEWLKPYFGLEVTEPIRLHVAAKRYLCATQLDYAGCLSHDSVESLLLQGGPMSAAEQQAFEHEPYWQDALKLRRIDEAAKDPDGPLPLFASFWGDIEETLCMCPAARG